MLRFRVGSGSAERNQKQTNETRVLGRRCVRMIYVIWWRGAGVNLTSGSWSSSSSSPLLRPSTCLWAPACRTCQTAGSGCRSPAADGRRPSSAGVRGTSLYLWLPGNITTSVSSRSCSGRNLPPGGDRQDDEEEFGLTQLGAAVPSDGSHHFSHFMLQKNDKYEITEALWVLVHSTD